MDTRDMNEKLAQIAAAGNIPTINPRMAAARDRARSAINNAVAIGMVAIDPDGNEIIVWEIPADLQMHFAGRIHTVATMQALGSMGVFGPPERGSA